MENNPVVQQDPAASEFLRKAYSILGDKGLVTDREIIQPWLTDWRGRYHGKARALAQPATTRELASLVRLCARHGIPIVTQGGNSGMVGGATPDESGNALLLSTRRMNDIIIDTEAELAICGAGAVLQTLHETAEAQGLRFPLSLGGKGSATVGGLVSTNAGGTQVLRHGVMRTLVAGLEIVLADGQVLDLTSVLKKDNRGFDLKQMFIGSEGTLGIVTKAVLQLTQAIAERRVAMTGLESIHAARRLLVHCQSALPRALEGFEVMPRSCIDSVIEYRPETPQPLEGRHEWYALIEFVADREGSDTLGGDVESVLMDAIEQGLCADAVIAANESQAAALWHIRETIPLAEKAKGPARQHDISVPVEKMPDFVVDASARIEADFPGHEVAAFGHLGDGNVHFHVIAPPGTDGPAWEMAQGKAISEFVYDLVTQWGGSISAEHGIGQDKLETLRRTHDPVALSIMRKVKSSLDPGGILNPGKLV